MPKGLTERVRKGALLFFHLRILPTLGGINGPLGQLLEYCGQATSFNDSVTESSFKLGYRAREARRSGARDLIQFGRAFGSAGHSQNGPNDLAQLLWRFRASVT